VQNKGKVGRISCEVQPTWINMFIAKTWWWLYF